MSVRCSITSMSRVEPWATGLADSCRSVGQRGVHTRMPVKRLTAMVLSATRPLLPLRTMPRPRLLASVLPVMTYPLPTWLRGAIRSSNASALAHCAGTACAHRSTPASATCMQHGARDRGMGRWCVPAQALRPGCCAALSLLNSPQCATSSCTRNIVCLTAHAAQRHSDAELAIVLGPWCMNRSSNIAAVGSTV